MRFLSAEKPTTAARIEPRPARNMKMIGRFIYALLLHVRVRAEHAPQTGQESFSQVIIQSLAHYDLRRTERSWKCLMEAETVEERGHARDDCVAGDVVGDGHRHRLSEGGLHDGDRQMRSVAGGDRWRSDRTGQDVGLDLGRREAPIHGGITGAP